VAPCLWQANAGERRKVVSDKSIIETIKKTFEKQNLGVLATFGEEYPYTSLVGFISDKECKNIIFATLKNTRKYSYLAKNPQVSILVNSSINKSSDFKEAVSITSFGKAVDVKEEKAFLKERYLKKFPFLKDFINDTNCVFVRIQVKRYLVVRDFGNVEEIVLK